MDELRITPAEAIRLRPFNTMREWRFVRAMMQAYGAHPIEGDDFAFSTFLIDIFNAGRVDGIRSERARKAARTMTREQTINSIVGMLGRLASEELLEQVYWYTQLRFGRDAGNPPTKSEAQIVREIVGKMQPKHVHTLLAVARTLYALD